MYSKGFCYKGKTILNVDTKMDAKNKGFYQKNEFLTA